MVVVPHISVGLDNAALHIAKVGSMVLTQVDLDPILELPEHLGTRKLWGGS